uniref:Uncharacterized protein n=1 Tax=Rhipicephalus microplus TaxID=6941 RepID=A0A6G5A2N3_RHIMP
MCVMVYASLNIRRVYPFQLFFFFGACNKRSLSTKTVLFSRFSVIILLSMRTNFPAVERSCSIRGYIRCSLNSASQHNMKLKVTTSIIIVFSVLYIEHIWALEGVLEDAQTLLLIYETERNT